MAHGASTGGTAERKMVDTLREVLRALELIPHLVAEYFPPDVWLAPGYPGASHLEGIVPNVRRPRAPSNPIPAF